MLQVKFFRLSAELIILTLVKVALIHLIQRKFLVKTLTRLKPKASVLMLAPVFALLAACGGASDPTSEAPAEVLSAHPADYSPAATEALTADSSAIVADAASAAPAPVTDATAATTASAQPDKLLAMTVTSADV